MKIEPNVPVTKTPKGIKSQEDSAAIAASQTKPGKRSKAGTVRDVAFSIQAYSVQRGNQVEVTIRGAQEGLLLLQTVQSQLRLILGLLQQARDASLQNKPIQQFLDELQRVAANTHYKDIPLLDGSFQAVWIEVSAKRQLTFQTRLLNVAAIGLGIKEEPASIHASIAVMAAYLTDINAIIERLTVYAEIQKENMLLTGNAEISAEQWNSLRMSILASQIALFYSERIVPRLKNEKIALLVITGLFLFVFVIIYFAAS